MTVEFSPELLQRYGGNVPRYTSYPTAVQFHERISAADYAAAARGRSEGDPLSIYVHVPFCWSPCYYCACNRIITHQQSTATQYVERLTREVELRERFFQEGRPAAQLHFGGGTPTYLSTEVLSALVQTIGRHFPLTQASARDYSIEIDPRTLKSSTLAELKQIGFNRLSLGVQDFDPEVQRIINRVQPAEMVQAALDEARRLQYSSVNFDLIYGLPSQSLFGFAATLERVMAMRPDRIALYGYAHLPSLFKAQNRFSPSSLPDAKARIALLALAIRELGKAGYVHIGMDHFALPEDSLTLARRDGTLQRSFQGYTTHADMDLVNFGVSAIGRVGDLFVQNAKQLHEYKRAIDAGRLPLSKGLRLSRDDQIRADVIQRIMCQRRVAIDELESKWGLHFTDYFAQELKGLESLQDDELIALTQHEILVRPRGEFLLRNIAVVFDAYAGITAPQRASKAI
jgi:oxygen-independent coproporphyrinogen-3 oxidase